MKVKNKYICPVCKTIYHSEYQFGECKNKPCYGAALITFDALMVDTMVRLYSLGVGVVVSDETSRLNAKYGPILLIEDFDSRPVGMDIYELRDGFVKTTDRESCVDVSIVEGCPDECAYECNERCANRDINESFGVPTFSIACKSTFARMENHEKMKVRHEFFEFINNAIDKIEGLMF